MADELLPCPFCGAPAELNQTTGGIDEFRWQVGCSRVDVDEEGVEAECIAYLPGIDYPRKADAIAAWNMRVWRPENVTVVFPGEPLAHAYIAAWDAARESYVTLDPPMRTHPIATAEQPSCGQDARDAARYRDLRWIAENGDDTVVVVYFADGYWLETAADDEPFADIFDRSIDAAIAAQQRQGGACTTCNGRGEVGGFVNAGSGYQTDPCPDCSQEKGE